MFQLSNNSRTAMVALASLIFLVRPAIAAEPTSQSAPTPIVAFVDKNGRVDSIEDKCIAGDKCDKQWLTVRYAPFEGKKVRVGFIRESGTAGGSEFWVQGAEDLMTKALLDTQRFRVVEDKNAKNVDFWIGVSLQGGGMESKNYGGAMGGAAKSLVGIAGLGLGKTKSKMGMTIRVLDGRTKEVEYVESINGSSSAKSFSMGGLGAGSGAGAVAGMGGWKSPSTAAAVQVCANKGALLLATRLARLELGNLQARQVDEN